MTLETIRKGAVRIVAGSADHPPLMGAGVFVTPNVILTARHVVAAGDHTDVSDGQTVLVQGPHWFGNCQADKVVFPERGDIDLALVILHSPKSIVPENCIAVASEAFSWVNVGDEVDVAGFSTPDRDLEVDQLRVVAIDRIAGAFQCNKSVPRGFSGGPVLVNDTLVGIMYARNFEKGRSYFCGGRMLSDFLVKGAGDDIAWRADGISPLRNYPLGPAVPQEIVLGRLHRVIDAYLRLHTPESAKMTIARANAERLECGPSSDPRKALIELGGLPNPHFDHFAFWINAFGNAGLKSPRMLAALLRTADHAQLTEAERADLLTFMRELETWRGTKA